MPVTAPSQSLRLERVANELTLRTTVARDRGDWQHQKVFVEMAEELHRIANELREGEPHG